MKVVKFIKLLAVLLLTLNLFLFVVVVADFTKILLSAKSIGNSNLMYFFVSKFAGLLKNWGKFYDLQQSSSRRTVVSIFCCSCKSLN